MKALANHPGFKLRDDAASAFDWLEYDKGVFTVNSAARTVQEQSALIRRWYEGGVYNRPPYLFKPAEPPEASNHVSNGGIAVDILEHEAFSLVCEEYGFVRPYAYDVVHFEYRNKYVRPVKEAREDMYSVLERKNSSLPKSVYDYQTGRATRPLSRDENTALRKSGKAVYFTVSDAEYKQRGGFD